MSELLSCKFNIDTACVELRYADGEVLSIYTPGIEDSFDTTIAMRAEWTGSSTTIRSPMLKWYWAALWKAISVECPASTAWSWTIDKTRGWRIVRQPLFKRVISSSPFPARRRANSIRFAALLAVCQM